METGLRVMEASSSTAKWEISERLDAGLRSLVLLERSRRVRQVLDLAIRGIEVEPIPPCLDQARRAILVSNYPSVSQTLRALIKVGCRLPGEKPRLKALGRREVITEANPLLKALGIHKFIFPAQKDQAGLYRLERKVGEEVLSYLDGTGQVLWLSMTGRTTGNGLLEGDLRTGAALFSVRKGIPVVPMGLVTREERGKPKVVKVRFGEPIDPPEARELDDFEKASFLIDFSRLALCRVARLLPPGQRGDFEKLDQQLSDTRRRLRMHQTRSQLLAQPPRPGRLLAAVRELRGEP